MSIAMAPSSLRPPPSLGSKASSPSGQRTSIAAHPPTSLQPPAERGPEGIPARGAASQYRSGPPRSWLKTKNMVESEFILLGTERDSDGVPWALLATDWDGHLVFAGPAILNPP